MPKHIEVNDLSRRTKINRITFLSFSAIYIFMHLFIFTLWYTSSRETEDAVFLFEINLLYVLLSIVLSFPLGFIFACIIFFLMAIFNSTADISNDGVIVFLPSAIGGYVQYFFVVPRIYRTVLAKWKESRETKLKNR